MPLPHATSMQAKVHFSLEHTCQIRLTQKFAKTVPANRAKYRGSFCKFLCDVKRFWQVDMFLRKMDFIHFQF